MLYDYLDLVLPYDFEENERKYLDKKLQEYIFIDKEMEQRVFQAFMERVKRKREKMKPLEEEYRVNMREKQKLQNMKFKNNNKKTTKSKSKMIKKSKRNNRKKK